MEKLTQAIQDFVNETDDEAPVLLRGAVVVWESVKLNDDGEAGFKTNYTCTEGTTMAQSMGLFNMGAREMEEDVFGGEG